MRQFFVGRIAVFVFINAPKKILCANFFLCGRFFTCRKLSEPNCCQKKNLCIWNMCSLPLFNVRGKKKTIFFLLNNVLQIMIYYYVMFSAKIYPSLF